MKTLFNNKTTIINLLTFTGVAFLGLGLFDQNFTKGQIFFFIGGGLIFVFNAVLIWRLNSKQRKQKTELRYKQEQLFSTLLDNTSSVVFIKDLEGKYLFVNK